MTLEFQRSIHIAISQKAPKKKICYPPLSCCRYPDELLNMGIERVKEPGWNIKVFNREKTLIDCLVLEERFIEESIYDAFDMYLSWPNKNNPKRLFKYAERFGVMDKLKSRLSSVPHDAKIKKFYARLPNAP